ncbi:uncharacterized protein WM277_004298 [Molossus nigricans]
MGVWRTIQAPSGWIWWGGLTWRALGKSASPLPAPAIVPELLFARSNIQMTADNGVSILLPEKAAEGAASRALKVICGPCAMFLLGGAALDPVVRRWSWVWPRWLVDQSFSKADGARSSGQGDEMEDRREGPLPLQGRVWRYRRTRTVSIEFQSVNSSECEENKMSGGRGPAPGRMHLCRARRAEQAVMLSSESSCTRSAVLQ